MDHHNFYAYVKVYVEYFSQYQLDRFVFYHQNIFDIAIRPKRISKVEIQVQGL